MRRFWRSAHIFKDANDIFFDTTVSNRSSLGVHFDCCEWVARWNKVHAITLHHLTHKGMADAVQIIAACPLAAGCEVHNTYGELGNAELVSKYGFTLRSNPFASVQLSKDSLVGCAEALLGKQACSSRCAYLSEQRCEALIH